MTETDAASKTSTEYVKAWRKREQERKRLLEEKGMTDVRVPVTKQQAQVIKGMVKMLKKDNPNVTADNFMFAFLQPAMKQLEQVYSERLRQQFIADLQSRGIVVDPDKVSVGFGDPNEAFKAAKEAYAVVVTIPNENEEESL